MQYWSSAEHRKGFIDILLRCVRRPGNPDRLYDLMQCGKRGFLGIGQENDGVSILRASGVGGGSLIYSNIAYLLVKNWEKGGGRERIRTSGRVTPTPDFESGAFNHSATLPFSLC